MNGRTGLRNSATCFRPRSRSSSGRGANEPLEDRHRDIARSAQAIYERHSTLCRTVPGSSAVPFSPKRRRVPSPNAHARSQGTPRDRSSACSFNDIHRWVLRCLLVILDQRVDNRARVIAAFCEQP
jgi:hypothetical protein